MNNNKISNVTPSSIVWRPNETVGFTLTTEPTHTSTMLPEVKDIEIILSPDATIIKDKYYNRKVVVKKCEDDTENRELAVTFALLKLLGITPAQVQRMMANAKDYRNPVGKKYAKKNTND